MGPWSVEDNLMVQISLPGHSLSLHSDVFLYFLWANEVQRFISL